LTGDGRDAMVELYETLPAFHRNDHRREGAEVAVTFEVAGEWREATTDATSDVAAVRLHRHEGAVEVRFDRPRIVKLAPTTWNDDFLSRALCRNILIDLLETDGRPASLTGSTSVAYTVKAVP